MEKENPFICSGLEASSTTTPSLSGWTEKTLTSSQRDHASDCGPQLHLPDSWKHTHTLTLCFPSCSFLKAAFWIHHYAPWLKPGAKDQVFHPARRNSPVKVPLYQLTLSPRAPAHLRHCHSFISYYSSMTQWYICPLPSPPGRRRALWSLYGARRGLEAVTIRASLLSVPAKEVQELFSTSVHPRGMTVLSESWLPFPFLYRTSARLIEMISLARSLSISPLNPPPEGATTELGLNSSPNLHPSPPSSSISLLGTGARRYEV